MKINRIRKELIFEAVVFVLVLVYIGVLCGCGIISDSAEHGTFMGLLYKDVANLQLLASCAALTNMIILIKHKVKYKELTVMFGIMFIISMSITIIFINKAIEAYGHWLIFW